MTDTAVGLRVVELGGTRGAGYAGRLLCDLGAEVVCVPTPEASEHAGRASGVFDHWLARGKHVLAADAPDAPVVRAALAAADVLMLEGTPATLERAGWRPQNLCRDHSRLTVVALSPFGWSSPRRDDPADDLTLQAFGSISLAIGARGRAPLALPGDQSSFQAGVCGAIAALAHGGDGVFVDLAIADIWAGLYAGLDVANAAFGRNKGTRAGHRVTRVPYPRTIYRCADGWFALQCAEGRHWRDFLALIGRPELARHDLFVDRVKANDRHGDEADALIDPWFRTRTKAEILALLIEHRIPGAPVHDLGEVLAHPHLAARGYFRDDFVAGRTVHLPTSPMRFADEASAKPAGTASVLAGWAPPTPSDRGAGRDRHRPLAGIRVVDFGWVWAGAVPGHVLADLGADVIRVESARRIDYMRQGRPIVGTTRDPEQNPMFHAVNRGKRSLAIDMTHPEAVPVLHALVAKSHVVIENFSPGVLDRFGLGWQALSAARPGLVMCAMSAVGQSGPLRDIRTYATMIAGLAGIDSLIGYAGERVLGSQSSYADPNASLHAVVAILAALRRQSATGRGAFIDLSQWEAAANVLAAELVEVAAGGAVPGTRGLWHRDRAPYGHYPALGDDAWISVSIGDQAGWLALRDVLDAPAWMGEDRFRSHADRLAHRQALDAALAGETVRFPADTLAAALRARGVPAEPLQDVKAMVADAHVQARDLFEPVAHPVLGSVPVYRLPWRVDHEALPITRRAPLLGEHNDEVLRGVIGLCDEEVRRLAEVGVLG